MKRKEIVDEEEGYYKARKVGDTVAGMLAPSSCGGWASLNQVQLMVKTKASTQAFEKLQFPIAISWSKDEFGGGNIWRWTSEDVMTDFHPSAFGILEKAAQDSSEGGGHKEVEVTDTVVAYLVIILPGSPYTGGDVVVNHANQTHTFKCADFSRLNWYCFSTSVSTVQVKPIESGFRVALTYELRSNLSTMVAVSSYPQYLTDMIKGLLSDKDFSEDGMHIAFPCQHEYPKFTDRAVQESAVDNSLPCYGDIVPLLKGSDAEVYHSLENAGLEPRLGSLFETDPDQDADSPVARYFDDNVPCTVILREHFDDLYDDSIGEYPEKRGMEEVLVTYCHDKKKLKDGFVAYEMRDHKRGGMATLKKALVILAHIPPREEP